MHGEHRVVIHRNLAREGLPASWEVQIDGIDFRYGSATPDNNNCLLDSLRQALPLPCMANLDSIRADMHRQFRGTNFPVFDPGIGRPLFVELAERSPAALRLLGPANEFRTRPVVPSAVERTCTILCLEVFPDARYEMSQVWGKL